MRILPLLLAAAWVALPAASSQTVSTDALARPAPGFERNDGQHDPAVRFVSRRGPLTVFLHEQGLTLTVQGEGAGAALRLTPEPVGKAAVGEAGVAEAGVAEAGVAEAAAAGSMQLEPVGEVTGRVHVYRGSEPSAWHEDVPVVSAVRYRGAWPGADLLVREGEEGLEYDQLLAPGTAPEGLALRLEGASGLRLIRGHDGRQVLLADTAAGPLRQTIPAAWQEDADGTRTPVRARFRLLGDGRFGFVVPGRDPEQALVIDPGLEYASFLGGTLRDVATDIAVGDDGDVYLVGMTASAQYPDTPGAFQGAVNGLADAFVARFDPDTGGFVYATYFGGNDGNFLKQETGTALALRGDQVTVVGRAFSDDFPTTPGAHAELRPGAEDGFVARFDGTGALEWSTYLGGTQDDLPMDVVVDAAGATYVTGRTRGAFPVTAGAFDESFDSIFFTADAFVACLSPDGSALDWSTYLGGTLNEEGLGLDVMPTGEVTVFGFSGSADFPTTSGAFDETYNGPSGTENDGFVTRLTADGSALVWSTFLGGAEKVQIDAGVARDAGGTATFHGLTEGGDLPVTAGAVQSSYGGGESDTFVGSLSADGSTLLWLTYLGGEGEDVAGGLALSPDGFGEVTVAGGTDSQLFPTTLGAAGPAGGEDAYLVRLAADGSALRYATLYGGLDDDRAESVALDAQGAALVVGETYSQDLPTSLDGFDLGYDGGGDAFFARFSLPPWVNVGGGKLGGNGLEPLMIGTGTLESGSPGGISVRDANPNSVAILFIGFVQGDVPFKGGTLVPFPFVFEIGLGTFPDGSLLLPWLWPAGLPPGFSLYFQAWIADPGAAQNVAASNGVQAITP